MKEGIMISFLILIVIYNKKVREETITTLYLYQ